MRLRGLAPIVLAALLLTPVAVAGSARDPDIEDGPDRVRQPHLDISKAWVVGEDDGLRFFIQAMEGARSDTVYALTFHVEETDAEIGAAVGYGNDGVLRGHLVHDSAIGDLRGRIKPGFQGIANGGLLGLDRDGAVLSAVIPWGAARGLQEGAHLHGVTATTYSYSSGSGWQQADTASTDAFVVAEVPSTLSRMTAGVLPILVPSWVLPLIVGGFVVVGAAGGFALSRRGASEASAQPAAAVPVPVRAPLPPPGQRFRAAPPPQQQQASQPRR